MTKMILAAFCLFRISIVSSQQVDSLNFLIGSWTLDSSYVRASASAYLYELKKLNKDIENVISLDELMRLKEGETLIFNADSTYIIRARRGQDEGTWSFSRKTFQLVSISRLNQRIENKMIYRITPTELWFKFENGKLVKYISSQ